MSQKINVAYLRFSLDKAMESKYCQYFRAYMGRKFPQYDLLYNRKQNGNVIYRYPRIQYRVIDGEPILLAINDTAIDIAYNIFQNLHEILVAYKAKEKSIRKTYEIQKKHMVVLKAKFGIANEMIQYKFAYPWYPIKDVYMYQKYQRASIQEQQNIRESRIVGHIRTMYSELGYDFSEKLVADMSLVKICKKNRWHFPLFDGTFRVNCHIPNYFGLGKSTSTGHGCCIEFP